MTTTTTTSSCNVQDLFAIHDSGTETVFARQKTPYVFLVYGKKHPRLNGESSLLYVGCSPAVNNWTEVRDFLRNPQDHESGWMLFWGSNRMKTAFNDKFTLGTNTVNHDDRHEVGRLWRESILPNLSVRVITGVTTPQHAAELQRDLIIRAWDEYGEPPVLNRTGTATPTGDYVYHKYVIRNWGTLKKPTTRVRVTTFGTTHATTGTTGALRKAA